jgi:hypothetical protein
MQSRGDVSTAVQLMQQALELDEKCEFAYETLGTIGTCTFLYLHIIFLILLWCIYYQSALYSTR